MNENKQLPGNQQQQQPQQPSALSTIFHALGTVSKWAIAGALLFILLVCAVVYFTIRTVTATGADIEVDQRIGITPTQIASIKQIGQWEFLSVSDEEMVDTTRNRFFADDELVRIYYGTLRLGIDMNEVKNQWIKKEKDSIIVTLPAIKLLDEQFIDEAQTKAFYESGKWTDKDREAMYQRARQRMRARCMNQQNIKSAEQNASRQFYQLMRSMGFENVSIRFDEENK
ncbi:MAG: DUF4230 domain-containing protein [Prevotella sp.]|nr:DUF4230 domain-containing protein [Prevotella sp.]MBQ6033611.1 DUF4230 domain-containing protein [Prevotella sp.]